MTNTPIDAEEALVDALVQVEAEVCALSTSTLLSQADGSRLLELAAREYEILKELTRPWRHRVDD